MTQMGMNVGQNTSIQIDNLSYNYQSGSNKLNQVSDAVNGNTPAAGTTNYLGDYHYASGAGSGATYSYDANGNLTSDGNKNISSIAYNVLNLPQTITVGGKGTIVYTYDAAGNKLQKQTTQGSTVTTTLYDGGIIYVNNALQFVATEEGRLRASNNAWVADYYLKDHLGNTRMVITSDNSISTHILEWTHYYPFGLTMKGISSQAAGSVENKYKFQKQELQHQEFNDGSGLEMYEFKYRFDDPQTGRFWSIDPLADKYVYNSPYAFSENKVTSHVELEGLEAQLAIDGAWRELKGSIQHLADKIDNFFTFFNTTSVSTETPSNGIKPNSVGTTATTTGSLNLGGNANYIIAHNSNEGNPEPLTKTTVTATADAKTDIKTPVGTISNKTSINANGVVTNEAGFQTDVKIKGVPVTVTTIGSSSTNGQSSIKMEGATGTTNTKVVGNVQYGTNGNQQGISVGVGGQQKAANTTVKTIFGIRINW